jgi:hypothetical protein
LEEDGEEKDISMVATNVLKVCQLTDMMIFWLIIWRMATLNFSYDYNM